MEIPATIGSYRIDGPLGSGGMGVVLRATELTTGQPVALKLLGDGLATSAAVERFQREAAALLRLNHPRIVRIRHFGQDRGLLYLAMDFIEGITLRDVLEDLRHSSGTTRLDEILSGSHDTRTESFNMNLSTVIGSAAAEEAPPDEGTTVRPTQVESPRHIRRCCELLLAAAEGLQHAHDQQLIHRDLKPENIMVDRSGAVHLIDFGLAKVLDLTAMTQTGELMGTPLYMSPEQVSGRIGLDRRTDIYSLGMILYELLTLVAPVRAETRAEVLRNILLKSIPPVNWLNREVSKGLAAVVHCCLSRDPDDRYPDVAALVKDLTAAMNQQRVQARTYQFRFDSSAITRTRPLPVSILGLVYLLIVMLLAGVSAYYAYDHYDKLVHMRPSDYWTDSLWTEAIAASAFPLASALLAAFFLVAQQHLFRARLWPLAAGFAFLASVGFFVYGKTGNPVVDTYCQIAAAVLVGLLLWTFGIANHRRWYRDARRMRSEYQEVRKQSR